MPAGRYKMILLKILEFLISVISGFFYWVVLPILLYIALKILMFAIDFSDKRDAKNYCSRHYGYKGKRRWWE